MNWWEAIVDFIYHLFGYRKVTSAAVLRSSGGSLLSAKPVTLNYKKVSEIPFTTDGTSLTVLGATTNSVYLKSGTYVFQNSFAGGSGYNGSTAQTTLKI